MSADPGETLDKKDPGDDVQRRFRYQHAYAAIQCAKLLDPDCTHDAVYCENFEDILLRKKTGTFEGVQVKTRQFKGEPFKSNDAALKKSIARFAELEKKFPGKFEAYHFVTNHGFWDEKQDKNCIAFLITSIKNRGGVKGLPSKHDLRAYIATICNDHDCVEGDVASAMLKMAIVGYESDLEKSPSDLRDIVAGLKDVEGCSALVARRVADNLMYLTYSASSMTLGGDVASLYELVSDFAAHRDALILLGKTICVDKVTDVVTSSVASDADNLLVSAHLVEADGVPQGMDVLAEKLERGGLQAERINKVKDFKASMEKLYLGWRYKQDVATANARLNHLKSLVEDDCVEAKIEASDKAPAEYAPAMYKGLRERLSERVASQSQPLFGATEEHLVGTAGILTEECSVWWSDKFELKSRTKT
ncbi:dsDNA nuclease domain-containing protein [Brevundimonas sp.]|uniref:dsDNA nuclease domain-containing protein n=1 Tax=Brevundimonas sp. TaxID=1871086 RepID=UPI0028A97140|nr:dsDNA nuclease domain-containing protein [Brevundimonas sp.]